MRRLTRHGRPLGESAPVHFLRDPAEPASRSPTVKRFLLTVVVVAATSFGCDLSEKPAEEGRRANDVLSTLSVTEWKPEDCPPSWPGPWTACPEADWVRVITETAGYRVIDETGSALVAEGGGDGFYIHATPMSEKHFVATAGREEWPRGGKVEGVEIFGDDLRRWWRAQGFVFWIFAGPGADSTLPGIRELPALVRATLDLPPPR